MGSYAFCSFFFFSDTAPTEIYTLSLHDALPISCRPFVSLGTVVISYRTPRLTISRGFTRQRSEEHTSELQSRRDLVCRLLLEKKKIINHKEHKLKRRTRITEDFVPVIVVCHLQR